MAAAATAVATALIVWPTSPRRLAELAAVAPPGTARAWIGRMMARDRADVANSAARSMAATVAAATVVTLAALLAIVAGRISPAGVQWPGLPPLPWSVIAALGIVVPTVSYLCRESWRRRGHGRDLAAIRAVLRAFLRELDVGQSPSDAAIQAGIGAPRAARDVLAPFTDPLNHVDRRASGTWPARSADRRRGGGGRMVSDRDRGVVRDVTRRLTAAAALTKNLGIPLMALVTACLSDLDDRAAILQIRTAQVAGPAVSGNVLAALPGAGILMGIGIGSDPISVLFGTGAGGVLLIVGAALSCAGLIWSNRIVRGRSDG